MTVMALMTTAMVSTVALIPFAFAAVDSVAARVQNRETDMNRLILKNAVVADSLRRRKLEQVDESGGGVDSADDESEGEGIDKPKKMKKKKKKNKKKKQKQKHSKKSPAPNEEDTGDEDDDDDSTGETDDESSPDIEDPDAGKDDALETEEKAATLENGGGDENEADMNGQPDEKNDDDDDGETGDNANSLQDETNNEGNGENKSENETDTSNDPLAGGSNDNDNDSDSDSDNDNDSDSKVTTPSPTPTPQDTKKQQESVDNWYDEKEENGGVLFFLFVGCVVLAVLGIKHREKVCAVATFCMAIVSSVKGSGSPGGAGGTAAKTTKYERVASTEADDEEWGWGDDAGNVNSGSKNNQQDDPDDFGGDDWGDDDDDWGDDSKDIEMTTPAFSTSNGGYNATNIHQRKPSFDSDKVETPVISPTRAGSILSPPKLSSFNSGSTSRNTSTSSTNSGTGMGLNSNVIVGTSSVGIPKAPVSGTSTTSASSSSLTPPSSTMRKTTLLPSASAASASTFSMDSSQMLSSAQEIPSTIGGMTMGITSLGPKKKPSVAAKPKKKTLIGASDDDIFASMGFGGPPSKPKPAVATPKKIGATPTTGAGRRTTGRPTPPKPTVSPFGNKTAISAAKPKTGGMSSLSAATPNPTIPAAPKPAPALIPDGFGDDDDLDLDLDDGGNDLGVDAGAGGGGDDWGDDDGDLDDLLFD
eukprot:CAMPEP_0172358926 /NCGR_PEP_ID=MMETSP1060-20121228/3203_1 /TAXON_ID=37318 /ORGANISM="Pseudo-nitzschia pungens, Strain cf. cingulata" /LENGTH=701 /DNA_ID=CAMNT_0013080365 /DNA_START=138 /DNA_END=2243 /DNA_ORIENTATION=+